MHPNWIRFCADPYVRNEAEMATNVQEVAGFLNAMTLKHRVTDDGKIRFAVAMGNYRRETGDDGLLFVISLPEDGEYFQIFCPNAWSAVGPNVNVALKACMSIQWQTKLIQFEYDEADGELRPIIEFPLEDAPLTEKQLRRCVAGLLTLVDDYHATIRGAIDRGVIEMPKPTAAAAPAVSGAAAALQAALAALEAEGRPVNDPQLIALRALLAGQPAGPATL